MSFRERPEYQQWRDAVFNLFGRRCILCGHNGNITTHHVLAVNTYPELAFDPSNGVPVCGNCHTEVNGNEDTYVDELKRRQRALLNGSMTGPETQEESEEELRQRAELDPSNVEAVVRWFNEAGDPQAVVHFYNAHHLNIPKSALLYAALSVNFEALGRWNDVVKIVDAATLCAVTEEEPHNWVAVLGVQLAQRKFNAMCELSQWEDAIDELRKLSTAFSEWAELHAFLSSQLYDGFVNRARDNNLLEESVRHALKAVQLAPDEYSIVSSAVFMMVQSLDAANTWFGVKGDYSSAFRYGKRALALASTDEERIRALQTIAVIYGTNNLYADAQSCLREAMQIDDCNVGVIADLAHCCFVEGDFREALQLAKRGLMLDPDNKSCRQIRDRCLRRA
jgi:tetratricopeptide (TPR) repeat protein